MAMLVTENDELVLRLSRWEKLGAFHDDIRVPRSAVQSVSVSPRPFKELRGMRAPGTGWPGLIALGTWRGSGGRDFVALYRGKAAVIVVLRDAPYQRLLVSADDAEAVAAAI
jgi:hypothetical protein